MIHETVGIYCGTREGELYFRMVNKGGFEPQSLTPLLPNVDWAPIC